jgi:Domain of unknown function (DUF1830)
MAQIIDPTPATESQLICCCYINSTNKIQIARITNIPNWYFERVVFPSQRLLFESLPEGQLEIHTGMMASAILSDIVLEPSYTKEGEQEREAKNERPAAKSKPIIYPEALSTEELKVPAA